MKRFMANARLQNKTVTFLEAGNLSLEDSFDQPRTRGCLLFLNDFLVHNQCVALQISVNFNISSFILW